ncbi:hypothetical protein BJ944DRAFT_285291 [Cunninghamella echinulata]|nr:hypothetical protein BJ944DRAFT_285291 [Cunninghamella echinulata]
MQLKVLEKTGFIAKIVKMFAFTILKLYSVQKGIYPFINKFYETRIEEHLIKTEWYLTGTEQYWIWELSHNYATKIIFVKIIKKKFSAIFPCLTFPVLTIIRVYTLMILKALILILVQVAISNCYVSIVHKMWGCVDNMPACMKTNVKSCVRDQFGNRGTNQQIIEAESPTSGYTWYTNIAGYNFKSWFNADGYLKINTFRDGHADKWEQTAMGKISPFGTIAFRDLSEEEEVKTLCLNAKQCGIPSDGASQIVAYYKRWYRTSACDKYY